MDRDPPQRLGNMASMTRLLSRVDPPVDPLLHKRRLVAELCRLLAGAHGQKSVSDGLPQELSPRLRQTLGRLLAGDSEKQIAGRLGVSPHTVHIYVKRLYRRYDVCSRGELLAHFLQRGANA